MKKRLILLAVPTAGLVALSLFACEPDLASLGLCIEDAAATATGDTGSQPGRDVGTPKADASTPAPDTGGTAGLDAQLPAGLDAAAGALDSGTPDTSGSSPDIGAGLDAGSTPDTGANPGEDAGSSINHVMDGINNFAPGEFFTTTSSATGYTGYVGWDDVNVYFGMSGADVGSGLAGRWVLVYLDGNLGGSTTTLGLPYHTPQHPQQATLPFGAAVHLRWKADGMYNNTQKWNGSNWVDSTTTIPLTVGHLTSGTFMEMSITRASIGSPTQLKVHLDMLKEDTGTGTTDWTYAGVPSTSFTDGYNPSYAHYFQFDLTDYYPYTKAPNTYSPQ